MNTYIHTHTHLMDPFPGLPGSASTRKIKPIWILLKKETVSGSGISWAICKSARRSRQITTPAPHHSDALPAAQPTASKHWMQHHETELIWSLAIVSDITWSKPHLVNCAKKINSPLPTRKTVWLHLCYMNINIIFSCQHCFTVIPQNEHFPSTCMTGRPKAV